MTLTFEDELKMAREELAQTWADDWNELPVDERKPHKGTIHNWKVETSPNGKVFATGVPQGGPFYNWIITSWIIRLFAMPGTGEVIGIETRNSRYILGDVNVNKS